MTSILVEHAQYVDNGGKPLSGGSVYIGANGADPVATAGVTTIYSDRELTVPIANPQTLGSDGRAANKIWVSGKYSIQVNDSAAVQFFQDLDAGSDTTTVNVSLFVTSVIGSNTITGVTSDPLSSYTANQQFVFETAAASTGAVTLNVDGVGAKTVIKNDADPLVSGDFAENQVIIVAYNATNDNFEWVNQNDQTVTFIEVFQSKQVLSADSQIDFALASNVDEHIYTFKNVQGDISSSLISAQFSDDNKSSFENVLSDRLVSGVASTASTAGITLATLVDASIGMSGKMVLSQLSGANALVENRTITKATNAQMFISAGVVETTSALTDVRFVCANTGSDLMDAGEIIYTTKSYA